MLKKLVIVGSLLAVGPLLAGCMTSNSSGIMGKVDRELKIVASKVGYLPVHYGIAEWQLRHLSVHTITPATLPSDNKKLCEEFYGSQADKSLVKQSPHIVNEFYKRNIDYRYFCGFLKKGFDFSQRPLRPFAAVTNSGLCIYGQNKENTIEMARDNTASPWIAAAAKELAFRGLDCRRYTAVPDPSAEPLDKIRFYKCRDKPLAKAHRRSLTKHEFLCSANCERAALGSNLATNNLARDKAVCESLNPFEAGLASKNPRPNAEATTAEAERSRRSEAKRLAEARRQAEAEQKRRA